MTVKLFGKRRQRVLLAAAAVLWLTVMTGCTLLSASRRAEVAAAYARSGEEALARRDYQLAAIELAKSWRLDAQHPQVAHLLGRAYEQLQQPEQAAAAYRAGLQIAAPGELRQELAYRLALLAAFKLGQVGDVRTLLAEFPANSARAADLRAVQALLANDGRLALQELNQARQTPLNEEQSALIYLHAAQAYAQLGERSRALAALYEAINNAGYAPFVKDIEKLRDQLKGGPPH